MPFASWFKPGQVLSVRQAGTANVTPPASRLRDEISLFALQQVLDLVAYPRTGAMQQHALILRAEVKQVARLRCVTAFDVAHDQNRLLGRWKSFDDLAHVVPELTTGEDAFRV